MHLSTQHRARAAFFALTALAFSLMNSHAQTRDENIALHRPTTFNKTPNYPHCADPDDDKQITDGVYTTGEGSMWGQKTTVGWTGGPVGITIDLGSVQPIGGASYSTGGGVAGVTWPTSLLVFVSDDKSTWHFAGDLVQLAARPGGGGLPPESGYAAHRYATSALPTKGRYVSVYNPSGIYIFCDEIEIYRGAESLLQQPTPGPQLQNIEEWLKDGQLRLAMMRRLDEDVARVLSELESAKINEQRRAALRAKLQKAQSEIATLPAPDPATFTTIFPQNETHAKIFAVRGALLKERGLPPLFAWKKAHRYAWLDVMDAPQKAPTAPSLQLKMMRNEFRAEHFLLTNAGENAMTARLRIVGAENARPDWLQVSAVPWTDTSQNTPLATALPAVDFKNGAYEFALPAGLTQQIWLTVDSSKLAAGSKNLRVVVEAGGHSVAVPMRVLISQVALNRPRLSLGMWDYTNGDGAFGITARNRLAAIALQQSHGVDSPWCSQEALPRPAESDFDAQNNLVKVPSFAEFDEWVSRWPKARRYMMFANVPDSFAGAPMGSETFNARVGAWAKALAQHMRDLKLQPQQLGLLLVDEPLSEAQDKRLLAWMNAIQAAAPELTIFTDPAWERPAQNVYQDAITRADIVSPTLDLFQSVVGKEAAAYYAARQADGQTLWLYQCDGPTRTFDPTAYFRMMAWHAFSYGARGIGFWSFGDSGSALSSWNEYSAKSGSFTPAYLGLDSATDTLHWQAVREGLQDYEYLAMLRDAAMRTQNAMWKNQANALLQSISKTLRQTGRTERQWPKANLDDQTRPDAWRLQALALLEKPH